MSIKKSIGAINQNARIIKKESDKSQNKNFLIMATLVGIIVCASTVTIVLGHNHYSQGEKEHEFVKSIYEGKG